MIRLLRNDEVGLYQEYIRQFWREDHIFALSKAALDFQYFDPHKNAYNILIFIDKKSQEINSTLAFNSPSQYDEKIQDNQLWLSLWHSRSPSAGLALLKHLLALKNPSSIGAIGLSKYSRKFYSLFNYELGEMDHFYIKNPHLKDFKIANFQNKNEQKKDDKNKKIFLKKLSQEELKNSKLCFAFLPEKSLKYFINRYLNHPFYKYSCYGIFEYELLRAAFFTRIVSHEGRRALLILDWLGSFVPGARWAIEKLLVDEDLEFASLLCHSPCPEKIIKMGFKKLDEGRDIIPLYYEPFVRKNQKIFYAYKIFRGEKNYAFFKGDADQDRINILYNS